MKNDNISVAVRLWVTVPVIQAPSLVCSNTNTEERSTGVSIWMVSGAVERPSRDHRSGLPGIIRASKETHMKNVSVIS